MLAVVKMPPPPHPAICGLVRNLPPRERWKTTHEPRCDQLPHASCKATPYRPEKEQHDSKLVRPSSTKNVAEPSVQRREGGGGEQVRCSEPGSFIRLVVLGRDGGEDCGSLRSARSAEEELVDERVATSVTVRS